MEMSVRIGLTVLVVIHRNPVVNKTNYFPGKKN